MAYEYRVFMVLQAEEWTFLHSSTEKLHDGATLQVTKPGSRFHGRSVMVYSVLSHPIEGRPGIVYGRDALALVRAEEFEAGTAGRTSLPKEGDAVSMEEQEPQSPGGPQEPTPGEPGTMPEEPETAPEAPDMPSDPDRDPSQSSPDESGRGV